MPVLCLLVLFKKMVCGCHISTVPVISVLIRAIEWETFQLFS